MPRSTVPIGLPVPSEDRLRARRFDARDLGRHRLIAHTVMLACHERHVFERRRANAASTPVSPSWPLASVEVIKPIFSSRDRESTVS